MKKLVNVVFLIIILHTLIIENSEAWDLNEIGINSSVVSVKHVSIIKNKAYLSIPRESQNQVATLIEATWPEQLRTTTTNSVKIFPNRESQIVSNCTNLQSVISTDTDSASRLYVLDSGFGHCPPKIIVYDVNLHRMIIASELRGVNGSSLQSIVVDQLGVVGGPRAYIGDIANEGLIVYCFRDHHWWFVKLSPPPELFDYDPEEQKIVPQQLTLGKVKSLLYITSDKTDKLFSINAALIRLLPIPPAILCNNIKYESARLEVKLEGEKIGPSKGLICDKRGGLYYYIPRDYVLVRWDTHHDIIAENHEILIQSDIILPQVEQIFLDVQYHVWILLGLPNDEGNHCIPFQKSNTIA